jgi:hypothetical protein
LAEVLGVENPLKHMAEIFEKAVDISLEKKGPKKKHERRLERERKRNASQKKSRPDEIRSDEEDPTGGKDEADSRHIPSEVRERLLEQRAINVNIELSMGRGVAPERNSRSNMSVHSRSTAVTRSVFSKCSAIDIIASGRSRSTAPSSFGRRLKRRSVRDIA